MSRRLYYLPLLALILALALPTTVFLAQGGRPAAFDAALADLSNRVGRKLTLADLDNTTSRWEWRGVDYADNTLECPLAGETVTPGKVTGYQIIFILRGKRYDYRVALADPKSLKLCTNPTGANYELPPLVTKTPRTDPPDSFNLALADLAKRLNLNLTLDDFNNRTSRWTWRWREFLNSQLECPAKGQKVDQVVTPGWVFTFVYKGKTYEYRAKENDNSSLFLCRGA